jgi:hypothetical protein
MFLPTTTALRIITVLDRGAPNKECIVLRTYEPINLQNYVMGLGVTGDNVTATPLNGYIYYFADALVPTGSWVFVYTGPGQAQVSSIPAGSDIAFTLPLGPPVSVICSIGSGAPFVSGF